MTMRSSEYPFELLTGRARTCLFLKKALPFLSSSSIVVFTSALLSVLLVRLGVSASAADFLDAAVFFLLGGVTMPRLAVDAWVGSVSSSSSSSNFCRMLAFFGIVSRPGDSQLRPKRAPRRPVAWSERRIAPWCCGLWRLANSKDRAAPTLRPLLAPKSAAAVVCKTADPPVSRSSELQVGR